MVNIIHLDAFRATHNIERGLSARRKPLSTASSDPTPLPRAIVTAVAPGVHEVELTEQWAADPLAAAETLMLCGLKIIREYRRNAKQSGDEGSA